MYLDTASSLPLPPGDIVDAGADGVLAQRLWQQVRTAFPDLPGSRFRLEKAGGDHLLLVVDEDRVFRFPRPGNHGLALEIKVLERLRARARVPVPAYDIVDPNGRFASYRLIAGSPLTPSTFSALPVETGQAAVAEAVTLLKSLHMLDPGTVDFRDAWPRMWSAAQFADRIETTRFPVLTDRLPILACPLDAFLRRYRADREPRVVIVHGDLVDDHLLVDEHTGCLTGIIDFSDVALGDPAHDLLGFWAYGQATATHAVRTYGQTKADPMLATRSRNHFIRYRIDRLYEMITDGKSGETIAEAAEVVENLLAVQPVE